ncbi:MAG: glycoside hydrolase family 2 protein [Flavobacterium sp.]|nr:MAG: glycoside hydrolase family 2 protein [Flavobacterium sp.]
MKTNNPFFYLLLVVFVFGNAQNRTKTNFGSGWEFQGSSASDWQQITIPHTVKVEPLVVNNQFQGTVFYRKKFSAQISDGEKTFLYFEGVMQEAEVFINGQKAATHTGGYLPFTVDISNLIHNGQNTVGLKVTNSDNPEVPPGKPLKDLDFNYYGGIYRNVYLVKTSKLYITDAVAAGKKAGGGVFVDFDKITENASSGTIKIHLKNEFASEKKGQLRIVFTDEKGKSIVSTADFSVAANSDTEISKPISISRPMLWSINHPNRYNLQIDVVSDGKVIGQYFDKVGIRKSEIRPDGYYFNDEKLFISGTNRHQEYPYLGYAISDEAQFRDAVKIKNAGFDFVRLSHYPQSEAFLSACDELGILVMNSIPGWQFFGNEKFQEHSFQDIRDMVRRDRNHPSVIFWETSLNESGMDEAYMKKANDVLDEELPSRHYSAGWIDNPNYDLYIPARQHAKAPDYWTKYNKGDRKIFIAEYGDWEYYAQNAGFSQKEYANLKEEERTSRQFRASGEKRLLQQAFNFREASNSNRKGANTIGEANWLMFDYNRGYANDIESSGIADIFRIPKFAYDFYRSQRGPDVVLDKKLQSGPMVSIATYWTKTSPTDVTIFSNCEEVALYLNDKLVAKQKPLVYASSDSLKHPPFIFNVKKFELGTLRAEGFIGGKKVADDALKTPGKPAKIKLSYDLSSKAINPDFPDVVFVYATITDADGTTIHDAVNEVKFELEGKDAELIGQNPISADAGIATILLRTTTFKKPLTVKATATGLSDATLEIK